MTANNPRAAALNALCATAFDGQRLDDALSDATESLSERKDRALARALAFGVCRYWYALSALRDGLLARPLRARDRALGVILLLGLHQLLQLRVPPHAAVNESVKLSKAASFGWAAGLVNAVLRRAAREHAPFSLDDLPSDSARLAHPDWLLSAWRHDWPQHWRDIALAGNQSPPMALRVNSQRVSRSAYLTQLRAAGLHATAVDDELNELLPDAIMLDHACDVQQLPGFADGDVSVQDVAAQLAAPLLDPRSGQRVLDACAAPGGKTTHLLSWAPQLAELVAVDSRSARMLALQRGLDRLALSQRVKTLCADARELSDHFPTQYFDRILLDAPCSGSGVIRRHPDIKIRRTPEQITRASQRQLQLLDALWPLLARGGTLLYATCSVMTVENRDVVATFLAKCHDAEPCAIALPVGRPLGAGHQILPGERGMDGFFYALLHKR